MKQSLTGRLVLLSALCLAGVAPVQADEPAEFQTLFDGKTLKGWDGNPKFWSVEDGAITGRTTAENPTPGNTFLIWRDGEVGDFELHLKFRIVGGNSGIQYRSKEVEKWVIAGYQADFDSDGTWTGILYEERGRGILAKRGTKVVISEQGEPQVVGETTPDQKILESIKKEGWNDYTVIARGNHLIHKVNGLVTVDVTDNQEDKRAMSGLLALQLHAGPPMVVQFKDIRLKRLEGAAGKQSKKEDQSSGEKKKVVFVAGNPSHGYGAHEHYAGSVLLAKSIEQHMPNIETVVHRNGWPQDPQAFDGADAIVIYSDGGGGHPAIPHLESFDKLMKQGVGLVCIHYAVEVPKGQPGDHFLDWIGGYFEMNWSVNPHWTAQFEQLPEHPITRGVEPFKINDEWYYHMRFREGLEGVTPILTDVPPMDTLTRPDGPHSGNPHVREAVAKGEPQHVAWAYERPDGGRGFGFTGGHFHWNWGDPNFRKLVLNAIVWAAKAEVPKQGVAAKPLPVKVLQKNQDFQPPQDFNPDAIRQQLRLPADGQGQAEQTKQSGRRAAKPLFSSPVVTAETPGHAVEVDVELNGAKNLYLVVLDGGNGFACDWADWAEPRLVGPAGEKKLTELPWKSAKTEWGQVRVNQNAGGGALRIAGQSVEYGIGTHANSVIHFEVPKGYTRFVARAGLDNGGTDQGGGTSVQFQVFTSVPTLHTGAQAESRDPEQAVAGLELHEGLDATLFASEPVLRSVTNLDIDARGRVWVCEVMNYRGHNGRRPEGDRILILEDTDGDGQADEHKVYYQGRDIDSAMGICVLGNQVIVSASPHIFLFTDENGDDVPDRKELLFSNTGQPQHDHSAHSFLFGPDGKLYWNFGNTGRAVHDPQGRVVRDLAGNEVIDNGKPYFGGMVFRCDQDGSRFEVLGHNFRNNYEVTVDSFGALWQSDNDDDGNRGVRINYVMEFGNYGYLDEMTGAGWQTPRTGMSGEIPTRHWHQNDPGVVPNLLQTGAGSPTGITVYEGRLLPEVFWDQVLHCDAGPNIVRAYPVESQGAGYTAQSVDLVHGARDRWFRPADVCVAPDGSVFITDWYDPGVGGHAQGDLDRGRIFRIAPPDHEYSVPQFDFSTADGAIEALKNPNYAVRYLAWTALTKMGQDAEAGLARMYRDEQNPRHRARALWLLGQLERPAQDYVREALSDANPDLRMTALRLLRQQRPDEVQAVARQLVRDPSPQVRREVAVALRFDDSPAAAELWAELAAQHEGQDRWYLEALGIAADLKWDACLAAWLKKVDQPTSSPAGRDIIWRSRAKDTPALLARIIADSSVATAELPRYFRAMDFQPRESLQPHLVQLAMNVDWSDADRARLLVTESLMRLDSFNSQSAEQRQAMEAVLERLRGTSDFVKLVGKFGLVAYYPELLHVAQEKASEQLGVEAIRELLQREQYDLVRASLEGDDLEQATRTIVALGNAADGRVVGLLAPLVRSEKHELELRQQAARAMAKTKNGAEQLLALARQNELPDPIRAAAAFPLASAPWDDVRQQAGELFPLPPSKDEKPLPPVSELVKISGDVTRGKQVFAEAGQCAKCHVADGQGKQVGPDLSAIGNKLSREALFESILYPSAGISHNYETYAVLLNNGNVVQGVLTSRTDDSITIKSDDAISRTFAASEIEEIKKQNVSLMPADLQKSMTVQDLADVVEYLTTLKASSTSP